jgi:hypothetical protein
MVLLVKRHLRSLTERTQHIQFMNWFIFYYMFWSNLSFKISWNHNNTNGNCTEFDATILQLHFFYIYPLLTLKDIFPPQPSSIYFILNLNRWNIWLEIVVEDKSMFRVYSVQLVLITKTHVDNSISSNTGTFIRRT